MKGIEPISPQDTLLLYTDASPSELFMGDLNGKIVFSMVLFFPFDRSINSIGQLKNVRKKRREKALNSLKQDIELNRINFVANAVIVEKKVALQSSINFLKSSKLLTSNSPLDEIINFGGQEISYGNLLCLTWYAICLHTYSGFPIKVASLANKSQVFVVLDLLPGDNGNLNRKFNLINFIAKNSELSLNTIKDLNAKNVDRFATGYASGIQHTDYRPMKESHEFCITDWICNSVLAKSLKEGSPVLSDFCDYLVRKGKLKIIKDVLIIG
jgi:hypothetical protein